MRRRMRPLTARVLYDGNAAFGINLGRHFHSAAPRVDRSMSVEAYTQRRRYLIAWASVVADPRPVARFAVRNLPILSRVFER